MSGQDITRQIEAAIAELVRDVNAAAGAARTAWMFFLALNAFLLITLAGVTHRDLLLNTPITVPILQVPIKQKAFFLFAPIILVLVHFGILLQHVMLSRKLKETHRRLSDFEGGRFFREHRLRYLIHSYFYAQVIAGPARSPLFAAFLQAMAWFTLGLMPLIILLGFQVIFLPYHDLTITWAHRFYVFADFLIVLVMGVFLRFPDRSFSRGLVTNLTEHPGNFTATLAVWLFALLFSLTVATIPDGMMDRAMRSIGFASKRLWTPTERTRVAFAPTAWLFEGDWDFIRNRLNSPFSRSLVVTNEAISGRHEYNAKRRSYNLRGRRLRYAVMRGAALVGVDLTGADLCGSDLGRVDFSFARLDLANLGGTDLRGVKTTQARLDGADFTGALTAGLNRATHPDSRARVLAADRALVSQVNSELDAARASCK